MLKILRIIAANLTGPRATVPLPGSVPAPPAFRGAVTMNPEKCIGCGMCSYVCVSNAITGSDQGKTYAWAYDPGRCTFCARCFDRCPVHAIGMEPEALLSYERQGERNVVHTVQFKECPECGEPVRNASEEFLRQAFDHIKDETYELVRLCERCRRRRLQRSLIASAFEDNKEKAQ